MIAELAGFQAVSGSFFFNLTKCWIQGRAPWKLAGHRHQEAPDAPRGKFASSSELGSAAQAVWGQDRQLRLG